MDFDWHQYFAFAQEQQANGIAEINKNAMRAERSFRVAISRAYYAAFNIIKAVLEDTDEWNGDLDGADSGGHGDMFKALRDTQWQGADDVSKKMFKLKGYRRDADYVSDPQKSLERWKNDTALVIDIVGKVLDRASRWPS